MNEEMVWTAFSHNWVFRLYSRTHSRDICMVLTAIGVSAVPLVLGAIGSLFADAFRVYTTNLTPYLNAGGFALALIAFGWFTRKLTLVLVCLSQAFALSEQSYMKTVRKWADCIANRNWLMVLVSVPFAVLNLNDTIAIWTSPQAPIALQSWVSSNARLFFAIYYGFLHVAVLPFLLGSGTVGLVGTMLLLGDIFGNSLRLAYYRRVETVVELIAGLVMWTLVALASVLLFGRSMVFFRVNIRALDISGVIQSTLATVLVVSVGSVPLIQVHNAITAAKRSSLARLEHSYHYVYSELMVRIDQLPLSEDTELQGLQKRLETINALIKEVESIPALPIRWPSAARVALGALLPLASSIIGEWLK